MQEKYPLDERDAILQKTAITFDVSVWELFWWTLAGSKLVLLPSGGEKNPELILDTIAQKGVSTMHFVPSDAACLPGIHGSEAKRDVETKISVIKTCVCKR